MQNEPTNTNTNTNTHTNTDTNLVDATTASFHLSVSRRTITRWAKAGRIKSYRLGGFALRFRVSDLDEFIAAAEVAK
jgi:excisionase family DNA binding protein